MKETSLSRGIAKYVRLTFSVLFIFLISVGYANENPSHKDHDKQGELHNEGHGEKQEFDPSETTMNHVRDAYEWHLATIGDQHISIPLPVVLVTNEGLKVFSSSVFHHEGKESHVSIDGEQKHGFVWNGFFMNHHATELSAVPGSGKEINFDLSITKNVMSMFISVIIMFVLFMSIARSYKKRAGQAPRGIQSFFEPIIQFIREDIAKEMIGEKHERYLPFLLSVFFFIWFNNLLGLLPGAANVTGNIAVTLVLAIFTFLVMIFNGNKDFWMHIFWTPGVPWWLKAPLPLMPLVEFVGLLAKPFSLMVRLFANITAGHIIILSLLGLTFIFESITVGIGATIFSAAMNLLELFVALLQAYVFTLLSAMYFGQAVEEHH